MKGSIMKNLFSKIVIFATMIIGVIFYNIMSMTKEH
jgi:hypothetical protein